MTNYLKAMKMKTKKLLSLILVAAILISVPVYKFIASEPETPILSYTFEDADNAPTLYGNASLSFDEDMMNNVLSLDGSDGAYAEIPQGTFDGLDKMTIIFDILPKVNSGNYFTFCIGRNNEVYDFFRIRDNEIRNAITLYSYQNEHEARYLRSDNRKWMNIAIVFDDTHMLMYVDGVLAAENSDTTIKVSDMGSNLLSYFGKSLYSGDAFFNGCFDNFEVYDTVLSANRIRAIAEENMPESPVLRYTFEDGTTLPSFFGNAETVYNSEKSSKVLHLDGSSGTYAEIPQGTFDGLNQVTIMFDVQSISNSGNYFTFAFGTDSTKYDFFRIRGSEVRNAITTNSYMNEAEVKSSVDFGDSWMSIAIVFDNTVCKLYINGTLVSTNNNTGNRVSDLGTNLLSYLGKSFYDGDGYFNGYFDNFEVYDSVIDDSVIEQKAILHLPLLISASVGRVVSNLDGIAGTDSHTQVRTSIDRSTGEISSIIQRRQTPKAVPVTFSILNQNCTIYVDSQKFENGSPLDMTYDRSVRIECGDTVENYTLKASQIANNPILPGMYADPDIDVLDGKFWIYPTTDGVAGWGGTEFHAFSSRDMVHWCDEGVILDVSNKSPGLNSKGVQIASSGWSSGNAWAPAIEEKNGMYYFYYCGRIQTQFESLYGEGMAIGVAYASSPAGPYTASDVPIVYPKMVSNANFGFSGQVIDPSVYTEGSTSYLLFGNGSAAMVTLNSNMTSVNTSTFKKFSNLTDFRESIAVFKRGNYYYFTWSCDDTGSENYHIKYGTASSLTGTITNRGVLLQKDTSNGILATGHQSVIYLSDSDRCFIAYHRFYTPLSIGGNVGHHRETCIDEITFQSKLFGADLLNPVTPTMSGVGPIDIEGNSLTENLTYPTCTTDGTITGDITMNASEAPELAAYGHNYLTTVHPVSCTQDGYDEHRCSLCGDYYTDNAATKLGHDIRFFRVSGSDELRMVCSRGDVNRTFLFDDYINASYGDANYDALIDVNGDGYINAKDYALINLMIQDN